MGGSADVTLTSVDGDPTSEAANKVIEFTGTLTGNIKVLIPATESNYIFLITHQAPHIKRVSGRPYK